jgi:hypothetical protein
MLGPKDGIAGVHGQGPQCGCRTGEPSRFSTPPKKIELQRLRTQARGSGASLLATHRTSFKPHLPPQPPPPNPQFGAIDSPWHPLFAQQSRRPRRSTPLKESNAHTHTSCRAPYQEQGADGRRCGGQGCRHVPRLQAYNRAVQPVRQVPPQQCCPLLLECSRTLSSAACDRLGPPGAVTAVACQASSSVLALI